VVSAGLGAAVPGGAPDGGGAQEPPLVTAGVTGAGGGGVGALLCKPAGTTLGLITAGFARTSVWASPMLPAWSASCI